MWAFNIGESVLALAFAVALSALFGLRPAVVEAQVAARTERAPDSGGAGRDRSGQPTAQMVSRRLDQLLELPRAEDIAAAPLRHAQRALTRHRQLSEAGRLDAAERALTIAWAALTLASRSIARTLEEEALAEARRRHALAEQRAARAREALEQAMRQRAELVARRRAAAEAAAVPEHEATVNDEGEPE